MSFSSTRKAEKGSGVFSRPLTAQPVRVESGNEGMARPKIVPFRCEECGGEFPETAGGICRLARG